VPDLPEGDQPAEEVAGAATSVPAMPKPPKPIRPLSPPSRPGTVVPEDPYHLGHPGKVRYHIEPPDDVFASELFRSWGLNDPGRGDLRALAAVPHTSEGHLSIHQTHTSKGLRLEAEWPGVFDATRRLEYDPNWGGPVIRNDSLQIARHLRGHGLGTQMLATQVHAALNNGFRAITLQAVGGKSLAESHVANGHYTWPLLGFDGPLQPDHRIELPRPFKKARTIHELFRMPGGLAAWKEHGHTIYCDFDLHPESNSVGILNAYLKAKGMSPVGLRK